MANFNDDTSIFTKGTGRSYKITMKGDQHMNISDRVEIFKATNRTIAEKFSDFMDKVWAMNTEPLSDGGVRLSMPDEDFYDEWHDARKTAMAMGGVFKHHRYQQIDGQSWRTLDFPDGSGVYINLDGSAFRKRRRRGL